jgi:hypothetical protein
MSEKFVAFYGFIHAIVTHAILLGIAIFAGGVLATLAIAALEPWISVEIERTVDIIVMFMIVPVAGVTGLAWLYFIYLRNPTGSYHGPHMHEHCQDFVYNMVENPKTAEQWAASPLPDRTRRQFAIIALTAPVTVFSITQIDATPESAILGLLLAVGFIQLVRKIGDTTSLRPLSQHLRYIFAGPFTLSAAFLPVFVPLRYVTGTFPVVGGSSRTLFFVLALWTSASVSSHCGTLLYDSRKIESEQNLGTSTLDRPPASEQPSATTAEQSSDIAAGTDGKAPTQVFMMLAGILVVQAVGTLIFLPFSPVLVAAAAIVQSIIILGAARYIAPETVRPRATLVGGGAVGGLGFLLGAEAVGRSTSLELLSDLSGGVAVVTIGFIAVYVAVAGVSGGPS